jgi:hypothetical protein
MIPDGESKTPASHGDKSHCFPLLKTGALNDKNGSTQERGDCFKPLFSPAPASDTISLNKGLGTPCSNDGANSEDRAHQQGFERGMDAGRQAACSLVRDKTAPRIKSFANALQQWNEIMKRSEQDSSLQILKLAVSIAEKILGDPPQCCADGLDPLKNDLRERLREAYLLEFKLNSEDIMALSDLMACENVHWGEWDYILASGDAGVSKGSLLVIPGPQTIMADDRILRTLDSSLSRASTK